MTKKPRGRKYRNLYSRGEVIYFEKQIYKLVTLTLSPLVRDQVHLQVSALLLASFKDLHLLIIFPLFRFQHWLPWRNI